MVRAGKRNLPSAIPLEALASSRATRAKYHFTIIQALQHDMAALIAIVILMLFVLMAFFPDIFTQHDPTSQFLQLRYQPPNTDHLLGTDELGRDIFSRIVHGTRYTLGAGSFAVVIGFTVGVPIGLVAGYVGGFTDSVLMRTIDAILSFPYFLTAVVLAAILGPGLHSAVPAAGLAMIPSFARVTRGSVLNMKSHEYITAAQSIGCSTPRIILVYILPNVSMPIIVLATLNMSTAILAIAGLGFLGLGLQPPTPEWGLMLNSAKAALTVAPHAAIFPGIALSLLVTACNLLGDILQELLDPRLRRRR